MKHKKKRMIELQLLLLQQVQHSLILWPVFDAQRKWGNSDTRSKKVDLAIVEMIATDNHPFTVVSGVDIKRLVALLEPRYSQTVVW